MTAAKFAVRRLDVLADRTIHVVPPEAGQLCFDVVDEVGHPAEPAVHVKPEPIGLAAPPQLRVADEEVASGAFLRGRAVRARVFTDVFGALGPALVLMYLILVAQFKSFIDPLAILISLPLSLIGVVGMLVITRDTLNIMSLMGVSLLMGVVAKNAILLLDFAKWAREKGTDRRTALIEAGRIRLRPIIMTTMALIVGMTPIALGIGEGADFRAPLGRAVIGAVITSTLLTLLVIPMVYEILDDARGWVRDRVLGITNAPHQPTRGWQVAEKVSPTREKG